jgi:thiamine pyrophosphate-dependent acetolactate synthase large subunit-like protein
MKRINAIEKIIECISDDEIIIASNGMISREVYQIKDRPLNFYVLGSMGMELAIGIGIAHNSNLKVSVISGDGAVLMSLGTVALHEWLLMHTDMNNLRHYILNNRCHATTGGQLTCAENSLLEIHMPYFTKIIDVDCEKGDAPRIPLTCKQIQERFKNAIDKILKKQ